MSEIVGKTSVSFLSVFGTTQSTFSVEGFQTFRNPKLDCIHAIPVETRIVDGKVVSPSDKYPFIGSLRSTVNGSVYHHSEFKHFFVIFHLIPITTYCLM